MEDRRIRRTRMLLQEALLSLMTEKGYEAITVQDLIDRADIGRSTFYAHYTDKSDLLHDTLSQLRFILAPSHEPDSAPDRRRPLRFSLEMFRHLQDQHSLLRALLGRPGGVSVVAEIELLLSDVVKAELDALMLPEAVLRVPIDLIARSVVAVFLAMLTWWVNNDFQQTPEQMDALFQTMAFPGVRTAIAPRPSKS